MNTIKTTGKTKLRLNGRLYKGYMVGDLPPTFGYIVDEIENEFGELEATPGIKSWFNYKGLTYVANKS
jgi:hypothetical protein